MNEVTTNPSGITVLVLGGSGFVGKNLVTVLKEKGYIVFTASRQEGLDLRDYSATEAYFKKINPSIIFNCAAHVGSVHYVNTHAAEVIHDNVQMALNTYKAVATVCPPARVINPLSNCSYPGALDVQPESLWWQGEVHDSVFSYGNAKKIVYVIAKCYEKQFGIKSTNFLIPGIFGPGDSADPNKTHALNGMIIRMIKAQQNGDKEFEIWGTGSPVREWAYIDDVTNILIESITTEQPLLHPLNLAQNKGYTIKQSAEFIAEALGYTGTLVFNTKYVDGAPVKILDDKKFREVFPNFTFFDHKEGIKRTADYYRSIL